MKSIWLIPLVSFIACKSLHNFDNKEVPFNTKYFTGIIKYKYTYESNVLNADSLKRIKPNKSLFRYDNNDYQSQFIGKDTLTYFYSGKLNKCLSETNSKKIMTAKIMECSQIPLFILRFTILMRQ